MARCGILFVIVAGMALAEAPPHVFLLDRHGLIHRGVVDGQGPPRPMGRRWLDQPTAIDLEIVGGGLYLLTTGGMIHQVGHGRSLPNVSFGLDISRDLEYHAGEDCFYLLDGYGGLYRLGETLEPLPRQSLFGAMDLAVDLEIGPDGKRLFVMDAHGSIEEAGEQGINWNLNLERPLAVDLEFGPGGIPTVLLVDGRLLSLLPRESDALPALDPPLFGAPLARDMEWHPSGRGGYVLDAYGGIHRFGDVPEIESMPISLGTAVDLELVPAHQLAPPPSAATAPRAQVLLPAPTVPYWQEQVRASVQIEGARDLAGFSATLTYDPELLTPLPDAVQPGALLTVLGRTAHVLPVVEAPGRLSLRGNSDATVPGAGASGEGELFSLAFAVLPAAVARERRNAHTTVELTSLVCADTQWEHVALDPHDRHDAELAVLYMPPRAGLALGDSLRPITDRLTLTIGDTLRVNLVAGNLALVRGAAFDLTWTRPNLEETRFVEGPLFQSSGPTATLFVTRALANRDGRRRQHAVSLLGRHEGVRGHGVVARMEYVARRTGRAVLRLENVVLADGEGRPMPAQTDPQQIIVDVVEP